jgi:hypothetical protein
VKLSLDRRENRLWIGRVKLPLESPQRLPISVALEDCDQRPKILQHFKYVCNAIPIILIIIRGGGDFQWWRRGSFHTIPMRKSHLRPLPLPLPHSLFN